MERTTQARVVIINRNYPPRVGVTGESACTLAGFLHESVDASVTVVTVKSKYAGGGSKIEPVGDIDAIGSIYDGKRKLFRLFGNFVESFRLIWRAKRKKADVTIVMTDPPFLSLWAALLLGRSKWALWSMDLYPEAFESSRLVSSRNPVYRLLKWLVYRRAPQKLIALGQLQADYLCQNYQKKIPSAIVSCGVYKHTNGTVPKWKSANDDKIIVGYCGNLGEAHSVDFLRAVLRLLDPQKFHLVLSVYGAKSQQFLDELDGGQLGVTQLDSVSRDELGFIDVHLVSLLSEWAHVCVPSKAVSAVCSGSSFLFYGTGECDNWEMLQAAGWLIQESDSYQTIERDVAESLNGIDRESLSQKKNHASEIAKRLVRENQAGFQQIAGFVLDK